MREFYKLTQRKMEYWAKDLKAMPRRDAVTKRLKQGHLPSQHPVAPSEYEILYRIVNWQTQRAR